MPKADAIKNNHESDDESEASDVEEIPQIDIDVSKLTPLSPEVISKQVRRVRNRSIMRH